MTQPKRIEIDAIFYHELGKVEPDFDTKLRSGQLRCQFCNSNLNDAGIYSVSKRDNRLQWCCMRMECIERSNAEDLGESRNS